MRRVLFSIAVSLCISIKTQAACVSISSPANGANILIGSSATIQFSDTCASHWFECLVIDSKNYTCGTPNPQRFTWNTVGYPAGYHSISVRSWTSGAGSLLGAASETVKLVTTLSNASPTPTPKPSASATPAPISTPAPSATPTPAPSGHYPLKTPGASLPSESACASAVNSNPEPENAPWNKNDGMGFNSNAAFSGTPSYFYQNAGAQLGYPNADFQRVDGSYGGSTDDIIRVYSCKYGEDEDWMRAQSAVESGWRQDCAAMHGGSGCNENGDNNNSDGTCYGLPSGLAAFGYNVTNGSGVYTFGQQFGLGTYNSWGIIQSKSGCAEYYTQPMLSLSTSWGEDYEGAKWRACVNGDAGARFNSSAYNSDVANARNNPNGTYTGGEPKYLSSTETNLQHLALGCVITHFSGGWFDSGASSYASAFVNTLHNHSWPGGLY